MPVAATMQLDSKTKVHMIVQRIERDPAQVDLFEADRDWQKQNFIARIVKTAVIMPHRFWFSELRNLVGIEPLHPNWWGACAGSLKKAGLRLTGQYRRSPRESRNGGLDSEWERAE